MDELPIVDDLVTVSPGVRRLKLRLWLRLSARSLVGLERGTGSDVLHRMSWRGRLLFLAGYSAILFLLGGSLWLIGEFSRFRLEICLVSSAYVYVMVGISWLDVRQRTADGRLRSR